MPVAAFVGAMLTMLLVVRLANVRGRLDPTSLLLAGVALSYTLAAVTSFVMVLAREQMAAIVYWMMGGFSAATWGYVWMIAADVRARRARAAALDARARPDAAG